MATASCPCKRRRILQSPIILIARSLGAPALDPAGLCEDTCQQLHFGETSACRAHWSHNYGHHYSNSANLYFALYLRQTESLREAAQRSARLLLISNFKSTFSAPLNRQPHQNVRFSLFAYFK